MINTWHLLQTSDSTFPVGGFAHSYGLEGMVQAGAVDTPEDLLAFLKNTWLPAMTHIDFPLVRLSREHARDRDAILRLDELAWACRTTAEARKAQQQMGAQRLAIIAGLTSDPVLTGLQDVRWNTQWPVICGIEAGLLDTPLDQCLISYGYQSINGLLAASAKLIRIGPTEIQRQLHACGPHVVEAIEQSMRIEEDDIGWFTPLLDITGALHETAYTRIFIS
jgi:urease accessory protein